MFAQTALTASAPTSASALVAAPVKPVNNPFLDLTATHQSLLWVAVGLSVLALILGLAITISARHDENPAPGELGNPVTQKHNGHVLAGTIITAGSVLLLLISLALLSLSGLQHNSTSTDTSTEAPGASMSPQDQPSPVSTIRPAEPDDL